MERTTSEKIRLGIFVIIGTLLLVIAAYLVGNQQNLFGNTYTINAVFKNVNGLQKGNNVRYAGINIGTVSGIEMRNDTAIRVSMLIQEKMQKHIKTNAIATIGSDGLVGSMVINVVPGNGTAPLIRSGDEILTISKIATVDMLNTLSVTNENAAQLTQDLLKVTASLNRGEGTLGRLLNDTLMANNLQRTLINLKKASFGANTTISQLNDIAKKFNSNESVMGVLLSDSISAVKMQRIIAHLEASSSELSGMSKDLNRVVGDIKDGNGALSYLATDTTLVSQLQSTMQNVEQGVERFNQNMEALKHNFLTRGYFRKLEKQERKDKQEE
ncbi:MlaD family protein [Ulvibacterium sp.]|uniref:MlaD family protein n=1 Tax=Ulvibacterium sp. TaxID=2665914 RepID=UPI003BAAE900